MKTIALMVMYYQFEVGLGCVCLCCSFKTGWVMSQEPERRGVMKGGV